MTAPPQMLHLMVVEGAMRFARQASAFLEKSDWEGSHFALSRSRACVNELLMGLDAEANPDVVEQLKGLFLFAHRKLTRADVMHDAPSVHEALHVLELHRETWLQLIDTLGAESSAASELDYPTTSWLS